MKHFITTCLCILVFAILCTITLQGCTKPPDDPPIAPKPTPCANCLPPITTEGKGTFGCKVNGKIWLPKGGWTSSATSMSYYKQRFGISGYNDDMSQWVTLAVGPISDTGYYDLSLNNFTFSKVLFDAGLPDRYKSEPVHKGALKILRFDPYVKGIISGTFEFDAYNSDGDTIHITEGRFDLYF